MPNKVDVAIIGAGPGGLFAAYELMNSGLDVLVLEEDAQAGGAGGKSDGKLNFSPDIGFFLDRLKMPYADVKKGVNYVEEIFVRIVDTAKDELEEFKNLEFWENIYGTDETKISELKRKADQSDIDFTPGKQRHMGTDKIGPFMDFFKEYLENNIHFKMNYKVNKINKEGGDFILNEDVRSNYLIISPGRSGSLWCRDSCEGLGAKTSFGPVDIGVRAEFPADIYEPIKEVMYDAKFQLRTKTYRDFVRTFCTNPNGFVDVEKPVREFKLINGHSQSKDGKGSENTNLAILTRVYLTEPLSDTKEYARRIAKDGKEVNMDAFKKGTVYRTNFEGCYPW